MRYRRVTYRYALISPVRGSWRLAEEADRRVRLAQTTWQPPTDVFESPTTITVTIEIAGVNPEEVDALIFDDAIVVEGQRRLPPPEGRGMFHSVQIRQGSFRVEIPLHTPIDAERLEAQYQDGLLRLSLPKAEKSQQP